LEPSIGKRETRIENKASEVAEFHLPAAGAELFFGGSGKGRDCADPLADGVAPPDAGQDAEDVADSVATLREIAEDVLAGVAREKGTDELR
jgi:hypothetical protein